MLTFTEENYLKAIYKLVQLSPEQTANTSIIAQELGTSSASVTDMIKKLAEKKLIEYERYYGVQLTKEGQKLALYLIRKHRLWETFLFTKLSFSWEDVHEIAEQLEHIDSPLLVDKLDAYLGFPKFDPHGDPIPNGEGNLTLRSQMPLSQITETGSLLYVLAVRNQDPEFLKYLHEMKITPGATLEITQYIPYDKSVKVKTDDKEEYNLSYGVTQNVLVKVL
jgi:DtxR family Mn-dependent transcriptional regulator